MPPRIGLSRILLIASAFFLGSAVSPSRVHAGFVFTVQSVLAAAGSTNDTLQVTLMNTGPSAVTIGGFEFELSSGSGVSFTSVDINTTLPYIFAGHSGFGPDISNQPPNLPGNLLAAEDFYDTPGLGISLGAGSTVGLGDVHFKVLPTASGTVAISILGFPSTALSDAGGNNISLAGSTFTGGTITVTPASVPEPSSLVLCLIGIVGLSAYARSRPNR